MLSIYCNIMVRHAAVALFALCAALFSCADSYGQENLNTSFAYEDCASLHQAMAYFPCKAENDKPRSVEKSSPSLILDFDDQGFSHSDDHGSSIYAKGIIRLTYVNSASENWNKTNSDGESGSHALMAFAYSGAESIVVETIDGSELDFRSFFVSVWGRGIASVQGIRDGVSTGTQTNGFPASMGSVVLDDAIFDNVDKMIINSHDEGFWEIFDTFTFGSALSADSH